MSKHDEVNTTPDPSKTSGSSPPDHSDELLDLLTDEINWRTERLEALKEKLADLKIEATGVKNAGFLAESRREVTLEAIDADANALKEEQKRVNRERNKFMSAVEVVEEYVYAGEALTEELAKRADEELANVTIDEEPAPSPAYRELMQQRPDVFPPPVPALDLLMQPPEPFSERFEDNAET